MINNLITLGAIFVAAGFAIAWVAARRQVDIRDAKINSLRYALKKEQQQHEPLIIVKDAKSKNNGNGNTPSFGPW
jgi:uncharacterized membrane protein YciS (DUF1049 family)